MSNLADRPGNAANFVAEVIGTNDAPMAANFVEMGQVAANGKVEIYLAERDIRIRLHPRQLEILQLYDGVHHTEDVLDSVNANRTVRMTLPSLQAFEAKLLGLGFLTCAVVSKNVTVDPFAGIEYGLSRRRPPKVIFNLDDVDQSLGPVLAVFRRPVGWVTLLIFGMLVAYGLLLSVHHQDQVWAQLPRLLNTVWWVLLFYPVWFIVMTLHEFGHALACLAAGVPMREVGIGRRRILFVGWAKPDQAIWSVLPYRAKVFTVLAGPLINLSFFAIGVVIWSRITHATMANIVLSAAFLPLFTMIPTLIPTNKGDAYLLLSEALGQPGYYTRATRHLWSLPKRLKTGGKAELATPLAGFGVLVLLTRIGMLATIVLVTVHALRLLWQAASA